MSLPRLFVFAILLALAAAPLAAQAAGEVTTPSGLRIIDVKPGTGPVPKAGQTVTVNYTGWLFVDGKKGKKFDSSLDRGEPLDCRHAAHSSRWMARPATHREKWLNFCEQPG